jgi:homoserine O-acetyltransferase
MSGPRAFPLGEFRLEGGPVLTEAVLGYQVRGRLDAGGTNAILLPGAFPGTGGGWARLIGPGRVLDPERFLILSVDLLGDGLSSAPSQSLTREARSAFRAVTLLDNLRAQHRLVTALGIARPRLVAGWSLGGAQAIAWAVLHPGDVGAVLAICGTLGSDPDRAALFATLLGMLEGPENARSLDAWPRGVGHLLADWVRSARHDADGLFRDDGFASADQAREAWEMEYLERDPADLAVAARAWASADPSRLALPGARASEVLGRIRARAILMACDSDRLYSPAEMARAAALIPGAETRLLHSPFGHGAGRPGAYAEETALIERALRDLLG